MRSTVLVRHVAAAWVGESRRVLLICGTGKHASVVGSMALRRLPSTDRASLRVRRAAVFAVPQVEKPKRFSTVNMESTNKRGTSMFRPPFLQCPCATGPAVKSLEVP